MNTLAIFIFFLIVIFAFLSMIIGSKKAKEKMKKFFKKTFSKLFKWGKKLLKKFFKSTFSAIGELFKTAWYGLRKKNVPKKQKKKSN